MRHYKNIIFLFILTSCSTSTEILTYAGSCGKNGFIDTKGKWVIEKKYRSMHQFSEGLADVCTDYFDTPPNKWGYINKEGRFIIEPQFDAADRFSNGFAAVMMGKKWGYIDRNGKVRIGCQFDFAHYFHDNRATVCLNNLWGIIDTLGNFLFKPFSEIPVLLNDTELTLFQKNSLSGFINKSGDIVIPPKYKCCDGFREGLAPVSDCSTTVFINSKGDTVINNADFLYSHGFSEGVAAVQLKDMSYIFIDRNGLDIFDKTWQVANDFEDGLSIVMVNGKYGAINHKAEIIIEPKHSYLSYIGKGFFSVGVRTDTIINKKGRVIWVNKACH